MHKKLQKTSKIEQNPFLPEFLHDSFEKTNPIAGLRPVFGFTG
jgi:hypothetical protein